MFLGTLLAVHAEETPPPLIDFDGTILVQFVLFLAMLGILSRLVFRPYLKMRDARHAGIDGAKGEATKMEEKARQIVSDYDARFGVAKLRGAEERARLRSEGAAHERQALGRARDEAQRSVEESRKKIVGDTAAAKQGLEAEATALARKIAGKIVGREVAP